jgi:hypothetical protein
MTKVGTSNDWAIIFVLSVVGGSLIILDGLANLFTIMPMQAYAMMFPFLSAYNIHSFLGWFGIFGGAAIISISVAVTKSSGLKSSIGLPATILGLDIITIISGGGFIAGFVLVLIASLWGILLHINASSKSIRGTIRRAGKEELRRVNVNDLPEQEKSLLLLIRKNHGTIMQNRLVTESGLSRAKITRLLSRLEAKGTIERRRMGMTNLIISK